VALEGSHFENGERIRVKKDCSTDFISSLLFRSWGRRSGARDSCPDHYFLALPLPSYILVFDVPLEHNNMGVMNWSC